MHDKCVNPLENVKSLVIDDIGRDEDDANTDGELGRSLNVIFFPRVSRSHLAFRVRPSGYVGVLPGYSWEAGDLPLFLSSNPEIQWWTLG